MNIADQECTSLIQNMLREGYGRVLIARECYNQFGLNVTPTQIYNIRNQMNDDGVAVENNYVAHPDIGTSSIEELIKRRLASSQRVAEVQKASQGINRKINIEGPFGIFLMGDPHIDSEGCRFDWLLSDVEKAEQTGNIIGINIGDVTNNWVGRLASKYAEQEVTRSQGVDLMIWLLERDLWDVHCVGNHDQWHYSDQHIKHIAEKFGAVVALNRQVRLIYKTPTGREIVVDARHNFPGQSQWNAAHPVSKAAQMGNDADILVMGHIHQSGYQEIWHPYKQKLSHCFVLGSYKQVDPYALDNSFSDRNYAPARLCVVDPDENGVNFITPFSNVEEGCDFLSWKRQTKGY